MQCKATTGKGKRCTNSAKGGSEYCGVHAEGYEGGRKSKLTTIDYKQVEKLARLGVTDKELADFFDVSEPTINEWKKKDEQFLKSLKEGKSVSDAIVADRLFKRATGYEVEEDKIFNNSGTPLIVPTVKRYPPDTVAAIFWLKNRRPKQWRDSPEAPPEKTADNNYLEALGKVAEDVWD